MTLVTTLNAVASYKLVSLVRGRYGWNGTSCVRAFEEGHQPIVSLNPNGGYQTLSITTWSAAGGTDVRLLITWPDAATPNKPTTAVDIPIRIYAALDPTGTDESKDETKLLYEGTVDFTFGTYDFETPDFVAPIGEGAYVVEMDFPGWAGSWYPDPWTWSDWFEITDWDHVWVDGSPVEGRWETILHYTIPTGYIFLGSHPWPWIDVGWPKTTTVDLSGATWGTLLTDATKTWWSNGLSIMAVPPGDTYALTAHLPSYSSFWGTHAAVDLVRTGMVIPYLDVDPIHPNYTEVAEWWPNTLDIDIAFATDRYDEEEDPDGTYSLYMVHSTVQSECEAMMAAADPPGGDWELLTTHDFENPEASSIVTTGGLIPVDRKGFVFEFPDWSATLTCVAFGVVGPDDKVYKWYGSGIDAHQRHYAAGLNWWW